MTANIDALAAMAGRYWDENIAGVYGNLMPETRAALRRTYIADVAQNDEAVRQLRHWWATEVTRDEVCGAFGCHELAVVHGFRGDEWVPGDYCAEHGKQVTP